MAFAPPLIDDFNRGDAADLGTCSDEGAWVGSLFDGTDGCRIVSNAAQTDAAAGGNAMHNTDYGPDVQAGVTVTTVDVGEWFSLFARMQQVNSVNHDGYTIQFKSSGDGFQCYRIVNASWTQVGSDFAGSLSNGDKMGIEVTGTGATVTIALYLDTGAGWGLATSWEDTHADRIVVAGKVGLGAAATGTSYVWDDFLAHTYVPSGIEYKRLYGPALLAGTAATLYTVPTGKVARLLHTHASNPSGGEVDLNLSIGTDAAATRIYDDFPLAAESVEDDFTDYTATAGEVIQGWAGSAGTVNLTISGYEQPA